MPFVFVIPGPLREFARKPAEHLAVDRDAALLEGAEHLIQDPHKILDEVRGTREGLLLTVPDDARTYGPREVAAALRPR